jgi:phosphotransferase system enzyme I (PtsI)
MGPAFVLAPPPPPVDAAKPVPPEETEAELARFEQALEMARAQTRELEARTRAAVGEKEADIFAAHLLLLDDPELVDPIRAAIQQRQLSAVAATGRGVFEAASRFEALRDGYFRSRAADVHEVGNAILAALGRIREQPATPQPGQIVVAAELAPSDIVVSIMAGASGLASEKGGITSHSGILARAAGVPTVMACEGLMTVVRSGQPVVVDGDTGRVIAAERGDDLADFRARAAAPARGTPVQEEPVKTLDGTSVAVYANIGRPDEAAAVSRYGADGVGLLRTEFLYLERTGPPNEEEQLAAYRQILQALSGKPLIIRTLDAGGDKPLPYLKLGKEDNPSLGWRGIRQSLDLRDLWRPQVRAILRAAAEGNVRLMFPMVALVEEVEVGRAFVAECREELAREGCATPEIPIGAMIEVPSAALLAGPLRRVCDFFSIGTNDLVQYLFAADRAGERVQRFYQPFHPAVLGLIAQVAAGEPPIEVGLCGEVASDPRATALLLGLGVDSLSVSPAAAPAIKAAVRRTSLTEARELAERCLRAANQEQVLELLAERTEESC